MIRRTNRTPSILSKSSAFFPGRGYAYFLSALPEISATRERDLVKAISSWGFSAHEFSDDELIHSAFLMLQHALSIPALEKWRISIGKHDIK